MKRLIKSLDDGLFNEALRRAWVQGKEIRYAGSSGRMARTTAALRRERSVPESGLAEGPDVPRFVGGVSGRSGTTWLTRILTDQTARTHAVIGEQGLFVLGLLRSAPYEYYQFGGEQVGRDRYLKYFHEVISRYAYKRQKIYGSGLKGLMRYIPKRAVDLSFRMLQKELEPDSSLSDVEQAFGRFYLRLLNYHSHVLFGESSPWISKEPPYGRHAYDLFRMIPNARLVIMVRDGREVALSMYKRRWMDSVRGCMNRWAEFTEMTMNEIDKAPKDQILLVRYEDLINNFADILGGIFDFLELPAPDPEAILGSSNDRIKPLSGSIAKWRQEVSADDQTWFQERYGHINVRIGYEE